MSIPAGETAGLPAGRVILYGAVMMPLPGLLLKEQGTKVALQGISGGENGMAGQQ